MNEPKNWSYGVLNEFNRKYYNNIIYFNHLQEEDYIESGSKNDPIYTPVWIFISNKRKYILHRDLENELPIKINDTSEVMHHKRPHYFINDYAPIKVKQERCMGFRELVDTFMPVKHSFPQDFLLYKIIALTSYITRVNLRVCSEASFGKDGVFNALRYITNKVAVTKARTFPRLEFNLRNDIVVLPELGNIEPAQMSLYQDFLLTVGDFSTTYDKSSLGSTQYKTLNSYDISSLSLIITYNNYDYYYNKKQETKFFDNMFQPAVLNRFFPIKLKGVINVSQFTIHYSEMKETVKQMNDTFVKILRTLEWYKYNYYREFNLENSVDIKLFPMSERQFRSFSCICELIDLYSDTNEEYISLVKRLYECHQDYNDMFKINEEEGTLGSFITKETIKE